jgi:hypothetical protein
MVGPTAEAPDKNIESMLEGHSITRLLYFPTSGMNKTTVQEQIQRLDMNFTQEIF